MLEEPALACVVLSVGEPTLPAAVRSLAEQDTAVEIVVVESGGTDPRPSLHAAGLDVPVVTVQDRLLPGAARNAGVRATRAPFVAFLASDCLAMPGWAAARLRHHRQGAAAVASVLVTAAPANRSSAAAHLLLHHRRLSATPPGRRALYGVSYARTLLDRVGPFREDIVSGEDSELNGRAAALTPIVWAPDVVTAHEDPRTPAALLRDQFARGARRARTTAELSGRRAGDAVALAAAHNLAAALRQGLRARNRSERARLVRGWPLLVPATAAYVAGALRAGRR